MKHLVLSDLHGVNGPDLTKLVKEQNPDVLVCLGDFDQVRTILAFLRLRASLYDAGKKVIVVPGNHDDAIYRGKLIRSGTIEKQGKNFAKLYTELRNDSMARIFIRNLLNGDRLEEVDLCGIPSVIVHGAFTGDPYSINDPKLWTDEELMLMWNRLLYESDMKANFAKMEEKGVKVMVRGHDHESFIFVQHEDGFVDIIPPVDGVKYELLPDNRYVISCGALFNGEFAVIDTSGKNPVVTFDKVEFGN